VGAGGRNDPSLVFFSLFGIYSLWDKEDNALDNRI
jgi:hypothetical protein